MTTFDDREHAYEAKLAYDEAVTFQATVRRNKWLGLWAAAKMGKTGAEAEAYANALVAADIAENGAETIFRTLRADFDRAGIVQSDHQIRREMEELLAKALRELRRAGMTASGKGRTATIS